MRHPLFAFLIATVAVGGLFTSAGRAAGLLVADGGTGGQLEIVEQNVNVTVNNGVAVTEVEQTFRNLEDRQVEALYSFPVPRNASVADFTMWINGKEMTGEVLEKKRAREIYNSYKAVKRDPGLLEQVSYRTFEMRIFPIAPRAEQKVRIVYYQELDVDNDRATYVYPLSTNTAGPEMKQTAGRFSLNLSAKSLVPITDVDSPSHGQQFVIAKQTPGVIQSSMELSGASLAKDVVVSWKLERPLTGIDVITSKQSGEDGYFMLTLTAGQEMKQLQKGMDYVFMLDISGSMRDDQKLELSQQSIAAFVDALGEGDRFDLMSFNVSPATLFNGLQQPDAAHKQQARDFLGSQQARGGTVLSPAMNAAYKYDNPTRTLNVVLVSDGMADHSERRQLMQLIGKRPKGARVFCIGVGNDVNKSLLEQVADESGGLASFISREDNFERQAQAFRRKLTRPVATDLVMSFEGGEAYDVTPAKLPNLFHGQPIHVYGRYKSAGPVAVKVTGSLDGQPLEQSVAIDLPKADDTSPQIERMWALKQIDELLKKADAQGSREPVISEIIRLGEAYQIVTEYTSFLVLENDAEFARWKIERRNALRLARDNKAAEQIEQELAGIRDKAAADIGPVTQKPQAVNGPQQLRQQASATSGVNSGATPNGPLAPKTNGGDFRVGSGGAIDPILAMGLLAAAGAIALARKADRRGKAS